MKIKLSGKDSFFLSDEIKDTFDLSSMADSSPKSHPQEFLVSAWKFQKNANSEETEVYDLGGIIQSIKLETDSNKKLLTFEFLAVASQVKMIFSNMLTKELLKIDLSLHEIPIVLDGCNIIEKSYRTNSNPQYAEVKIVSIYSHE